MNRGPASPARTVVATTVAFVGLIFVWDTPVRSADPLFPPAFEQYLTTIVHPNTSERRRLLAGEAITKVLETPLNRHVSVFGAIWINAPMHRYVQAVQNIERFEEGGSFHITRKISAPPRLQDFDDLDLTEATVNDLRDCRVGDCALKLDARMIRAFNALDWTSPDRHKAAEVLMRRFVFEYAQSYLAGGNARLQVFADKSEPLVMADEFKALVDDVPMLTVYMPQVGRYLLEYPRSTLPGSTSFLYWQEAEFGLKPTLRLSHMTISESADRVVLASKMIYANHYFHSALELRLLLPDPARGSGFWFVTVVTSRTDGMTGLLGLFVRPRIRSGARDGSADILIGTKRKLEAPAGAAPPSRTVQ